MDENSERKILVVAATRRDGYLTEQILRGVGISAEVLPDVAAMCQQAHVGAGALLLAQEVLTPSNVEALRELSRDQPAWSNLTIIVLVRAGELSKTESAISKILEPLPNVTILERPLRVTTFIGITKAALADRERQYQAKDVLDQLEKSNAALQEFAYIAAHDLKEPLRTISINLSLLLRKLGPDVASEVSTFISQSTDAARRMNGLISDLLEYSKIDDHGSEFGTIDTNGVIDEVLENLQVLISESGAKVTRTRLPTLVGNRTQIVQLFQNLINNALKFRGEAPPEISVSGHSDGNEIQFSVVDNGIGFDMQYASHIFGMFKRLHNKGKYPGTGLGLALCKRIVENHHGSISVESAVGHGASFRFTFPVAN